MSMGFPRQEFWSRLSLPSPGDLSDPGIKPTSLALAGGFFTTAPTIVPITTIANKKELPFSYLLAIYCVW